MKNISTDELSNILKEHKKYLLSDGLEGNFADLSGANLYRADLRGANLSWAELSWAELSGADLRGANLYMADLSGAELSKANLRGANLSWAELSWAELSKADLSRANLSGAELSGTNLYRANLSGAELSGADLRGANLYMADLSGAELSGADLRGAKLYRADLSGANNINIPLSCPEKGSFIGFKKVRENLIVELQILDDSLRSSATGRKCRCSKAKVISITNLDGSNSEVTSINSKYDENFIYTVGEIVEVKDFDTNRFNECAPGIHFFITRDEAVNY